MEVLIADSLAGGTKEALESLRLDVRIDTSLTTDRLVQEIGSADILVVRSTKVNAAVIDAASSLALIIRAGAGVNTIDLDAAGRRGIYVANCPGKNTEAVAELALGMMIAADRRLVDATLDLRAGAWKKGEYGKARGLAGRRLGIVGLGAIGNALRVRAAALGMQPAAWSRSLTPERAEELDIEYCETLTDLASRSDIVSVHIAAGAGTKGLIGDDFFAAMKPGSIFINTARGDIVDSAALRTAVTGKGIKVGLDVFADEPAGSDAVFESDLPALLAVASPHIGASTDQSREAIAAEVVRIVASFLETGHPANVVNLRQRTPARHILVVRHYNRVGVLAGVLHELRQAGVNVEEMENAVFESGTTASCTLRLDSDPGAPALNAIRDGKDVIHVIARQEEG